MDLQSCGSAEGSDDGLQWVGAGPCEGADLSLSHLYLNSVPWLFPQCSPTSVCCTETFTHSFLEVLLKVGQAFNPPLHPVAQLQSARSLLEPPARSLQISDQHWAALLSSHQHLTCTPRL